MNDTLERIDGIASSLALREGSEVFLADNPHISAVKCYTDTRLYYVMAYKSSNLYSFSEYTGDDSEYISELFSDYYSLVNYLCKRGIINIKIDNPEYFN